ncbi:uncharacterized protein LOC131679980 [Topomyia yanbarensis]|uniref:uncharacterized protein LOC131679980 n=1 Tax=Topomyia yanbarensis TaxID=2498891 RepID=UPI00273B7EB2|nr:uncharacterized protein LOC131679980 [Topomyia yanbarensis]
MLNLATLAIVFSTYGIGILEALVTCRENVEIWVIFRDIEQLLNSGGKQQLAQAFAKCYLEYFIRFFSSLLVYIAMLLVEVFVVNHDQIKMQIFVFTFNITLLITCFRICHIELYLSIVNTYLSEIDRQLSELVQAIDYGLQLKNTKYSLHNLRRLKRLENCFKKCACGFETLNRQFAVSTGLNCLKIRFLLIEDIYCLIDKLVQGSFQLEMGFFRHPNKLFSMNWIWTCENLYSKRHSIISTLNLIEVAGRNSIFNILVNNLIFQKW